MPLLAKDDVTVHRLLPGVNPTDTDPAYEAAVLVYGDVLEEDQVPQYVLDGVKAGTAGALVKVSRAEADKAAEEAEQVRKDAEAQRVDGRNSEEAANEAN